MPLFKVYSERDYEVFVCKYEEGEIFDKEHLIERENLEKFKSYQPKKLLEALMVRQMLSQKLPNSKILYKENGEPYLDSGDFELSVSHSFPFAAIALSKNKIGVDLESFKEKIIRVKDKFIQPDEQQFIPENQLVEYLTIIWSIKESLYKIHHSNYWSLKKHYEVRPFKLDDEYVSCRVYDDHFSDEFIAKIYLFENFVLSVVLKKQ